jgi:hypothetical protein
VGGAQCSIDPNSRLNDPNMRPRTRAADVQPVMLERCSRQASPTASDRVGPAESGPGRGWTRAAPRSRRAATASQSARP